MWTDFRGQDKTFKVLQRRKNETVEFSQVEHLQFGVAESIMLLFCELWFFSNSSFDHQEGIFIHI